MSLSCEGIMVTYGSGHAQTIALKDVSVNIPDGHTMALTGPSGSGKSTLIRVLAGLQVPTSGRVLLNGSEVTAKNALEARRRHVGIVFQDYRLVPFLSVKENVLLRIEVSREATPPARDLDVLFEGLGLGELQHRPCHSLSGGEQQRVGIARALVGRPSVVLADEPTGALDADNSREAMKHLTEMARQFGVSVVVATHDRDVATMMKSEVAIDRSVARVIA